MFCKNCGKEIDDNAFVCPHCGVKVERTGAPAASNLDNGSKIGWGILSFMFPLVGLILFIMWKTERPKTAKVCGICALISFLGGIVISIVYSVIGVLLVGSSLAALPLL